MKAYLALTGGLFGFAGIAHLIRIFVERQQAADLGWLAINLALFLVGTGVSVWAVRLYRLQGRR